MAVRELPEIDVVVPAFNCAHSLKRALDSVWATNYPRLSVQIVDDGSSDDTFVVASGLAASAPGNCRVLCHSDGANHGVSASRNLGIITGCAPWVAFLDADDAYLPNRFDWFVAAARADNLELEVEAIHELTEVSLIEGDPESAWMGSSGGSVLGMTGEIKGLHVLSELLRGNSWGTGAVLIRRSVLEQVGLFDLRRRIAEDCHLWMRIAARGRVVPGDSIRPVALYFRHGENTYRYTLENRLKLFDAMLDAERCVRTSASRAVRGRFAKGVASYGLQTIIGAREAHRSDIAWGAFRLMWKHRRAGFFASASILRQLQALMRNDVVAAIGRRNHPLR
jgi:glycosyltransferase involved in cell wall biosynthesis